MAITAALIQGAFDTAAGITGAIGAGVAADTAQQEKERMFDYGRKVDNRNFLQNAKTVRQQKLRGGFDRLAQRRDMLRANPFSGNFEDDFFKVLQRTNTNTNPGGAQ